MLPTAVGDLSTKLNIGIFNVYVIVNFRIFYTLKIPFCAQFTKTGFFDFGFSFLPPTHWPAFEGFVRMIYCS